MWIIDLDSFYFLPLLFIILPKQIYEHQRDYFNRYGAFDKVAAGFYPDDRGEGVAGTGAGAADAVRGVLPEAYPDKGFYSFSDRGGGRGEGGGFYGGGREAGGRVVFVRNNRHDPECNYLSGVPEEGVCDIAGESVDPAGRRVECDGH